MKFCKNHNKVITFDNVLLHIDGCQIIEKTFEEIYRDAVQNTKTQESQS